MDILESDQIISLSRSSRPLKIRMNSTVKIQRKKIKMEIILRYHIWSLERNENADFV